jgi:leucine dehydrogenase
MNAKVEALSLSAASRPFNLDGEPPHERVLFVSDVRTQLRAIIAIHNTARGPGFGGCRIWQYGSDEEGLRDALRLSWHEPEERNGGSVVWRWQGRHLRPRPSSEPN